MRVYLRRALTFVSVVLALVLLQREPTLAQDPAFRPSPLVFFPENRTRIEVLLATWGVPLATDYYRIDLRFGPALRIDAVVVASMDSTQRARGLRVQVRDETNRSRQEGVSFLDMDEVVSLSRALTPMAELAAKWTGHDDRRAMDVTFTSSGGFRLAIREFGRVQRVFVSTGLIDPVATSIDVNDLGTLRHALNEALAILNVK